MTRKEFWALHDAMANRSQDRTQLHRDYHAQYVTPGIRNMVRHSIGEKELRASTDPHLNDIPLRRWDALVPCLPASVPKLLKANGEWLTLANGVSILKEAARQILEGKV